MPSLLHEAAENVKDLFRHQTISVIDEHGNTVQKKTEIKLPQNPITLFMKLTWKNWLFFLVGEQSLCMKAKSTPNPPSQVLRAGQWMGLIFTLYHSRSRL
jgi:hypothetical protein